MSDSTVSNTSELPWRVQREPLFTFNMGWRSIVWLIVILVVLVVVCWIFVGRDRHEFIGLPHFDPDHRPSSILDEDTMNFLNLRDDNFNSSASELQSLDQVTPLRSTRRSSRSSVRSEGSSSVQYSTRYSESQPAEIVLTNGTMESLNHVAPRVNGQSDYPLSTAQLLDAATTSPYSEVTSLREVEISGRPDDVSSGRRSFIFYPRPTNPTPRFDELDLGTFEERKSQRESKGERICREFLTRYYDRPFPNVRPDFLKNPLTGRNLELDGYNQEMGLAFEYNGIQHYQYPNPFHRSQEQFEQQLRRDNYKREVCERLGIYLVNIPYDVPHHAIPQYIRDRLPHYYQR